MGRKKKINNSKQQEEIKTNTNNTILYQGTVKVSISNGNKIISSKTFHNEGKTNLFKFICNCLSGTFDSASKPQKIVLFNNKNSVSISSQDDVLFTYDNVSTPAILNDTTAVVGTDGTTVTYHFRIPYSYISSNIIYAAALFGASPDLSTPYTYLYATYKFTDEAVTTWKPIQIDNTLSGNWSIIIEWTMTIKNYTKTSA